MQHPTGEDTAPSDMAIRDMIDNNDLPSLRAALAVTHSPTTVEGRYNLHGFAAMAASCGQLEMLEYNKLPIYTIARSTPLTVTMKAGKEGVALFLLELHQTQHQQQQQ